MPTPVAWRFYPRRVDMSGIIFAALAVGWAVYLIPKALQQNEELAKTRAVSTFSGRMRVLGSGRPAAPPAPEVVPSSTPASVPGPVPVAGPRLTREAARRAAARRRRVLLVLVFALGMVGALAGFAIAPVWAPAIPAGLIVVFLVTARMSVRRQSRRFAASPIPSVTTMDADEDTQGIDLSELRPASVVAATPGPVVEPASRVEAPVASAPDLSAPVADEGSLWDPLPLTLPTYVTKPTARRTVRTISLTQTTSSGHDAADTKLAREAEAARKASASSDASASSASSSGQGPARKVAGA